MSGDGGGVEWNGEGREGVRYWGGYREGEGTVRMNMERRDGLGEWNDEGKK